MSWLLTMEIVIQREIFTEDSTQGEMLIDGIHFCWTLEPRKDQSHGKPFCIPAGVYRTVFGPSTRFEMITPHLLGVPDFTEIELHPGNYPEDTEGCTLVGYSKSSDFVGDSRQCFSDLMRKLMPGIEITYLD